MTSSDIEERVRRIELLVLDVDGVLTVTVWDKNGIPLAERLVFREPANPLKICIRAEKKNYVPGDRAKLIVKATDAQGKPVSAVVGLTVTDDSVLEMVEKREAQSRAAFVNAGGERILQEELHPGKDEY